MAYFFDMAVSSRFRGMKILNLLALCVLIFSLANIVPMAEARIRRYKWEVKYEYKSPDCFRKVVITINGRTPGPTIQARQNDTVIVELKNSLLTENVAIHWHGIRQVGFLEMFPFRSFWNMESVHFKSLMLIFCTRVDWNSLG